jgi:hypothetical protein
MFLSRKLDQNQNSNFQGNIEEAYEIMMEEQAQYHNLTVAMIRLEHTAIIKDDIALFEAGAGEWVDKIIKFIKDTWKKFVEFVKGIGRWIMGLFSTDQRIKNLQAKLKDNKFVSEAILVEGLKKDENFTFTADPAQLKDAYNAYGTRLDERIQMVEGTAIGLIKGLESKPNSDLLNLKAKLAGKTSLNDNDDYKEMLRKYVLTGNPESKEDAKTEAIKSSELAGMAKAIITIIDNFKDGKMFKNANAMIEHTKKVCGSLEKDVIAKLEESQKKMSAASGESAGVSEQIKSTREVSSIAMSALTTLVNLVKDYTGKQIAVAAGFMKFFVEPKKEEAKTENYNFNSDSTSILENFMF